MSGLFGGGGGQSSQQQVYLGMQVSTSLLGSCIPYVAGRQRVSSNLVWYGNWKVTTSNAGGGKGGGGSGTKQYSYSTAFIAVLAIGPIQGVTQVWHDKALVTLTYENLALALGTSGQATWGGFPAGTPANEQIPYDHLAYVASSAYNLGNSAAMPNLTYELEGVVPSYSVANSIYDADPSAVISDYLLDSVHGALGSYPGTPLTIGSSAFPLQGATDSWQAYVMAVPGGPLLTSPYEDTQRQATEFVSELLKCTNSQCRLSCGVMEIIPYCDSAVSATVAVTAFSYTPNLTPQYIFTDDDYCPEGTEPPVQLKQTPQSDTYNTLNVEYVDRANYYNTASANCSDLNDVAQSGPRLAPTFTAHQITTAQVAKTAGQLWLWRQLYEVNRYTFKVRQDYSLLEVLDYIGLNDSTLGLVNQVCQIEEIDEDYQDGIGRVLVITAVELPGVTRTSAQYNWAASQGYFANYETDPGAIQTPAIFVMPPIPAALSEGITIGIAACGQTSNAAWLGCDVYCSVDGGSTYQFVGVIPEACRYGTLTANLGAVADPDTTSTLSIALQNTNLQLSTAVTHADADSVQTPILVGTGATAEVMSYGAAALASAGHYNLSYLRRELYGSVDQSHSTSDPFVRLDGAIFQLAIDPGYAGQTLNFKFVSFNSWHHYGNQTLAAATAYSYAVPNANAISGNATLIPRGTCAVSADGTTVYKATSGTSGAWDSDAYSSQGYLNGASVSWRAAQTNKELMVGFSTNPSASVSYTSLNFGLYSTSLGTIQIYESGTLVYNSGTYATGDSFEVRYDGVTVRYFHNGALLRAIRAPGLLLYPKTCIADAGGVVSGLEFGPASAVNQPTGSWLNTYPWVIGTNGSQGNYSDIQSSSIVMAGTGIQPVGPYGTSEALWKAPGQAVSGPDGGWNNNGDLYGIDSSKTYRSVVWVYWNGGAGASEFFHGCDGTYTNNLNGTPNSNPYFVSFTCSGTIAPNKWYLAVGVLHAAGYAGNDSGMSGLYDPATGQRIVAGTDFTCIAGAPYQQQRVYNYYSANTASVLYFAKPRFEEVNGNEPSLQALMQPASAYQGWVETGNSVQTGQAFSKQGGASAWDSTAYTVNAYSTCHISGKPIVTSGQAMLGLADQPAASNLSGGTAYAPPGHSYMWYTGAGTWEIYEGTTLVGTYGSVAATDLVEITYDGTTVTYYLNKVSQRTVAVAGLSLHGWFAPYNPGDGFNSVSFGPTTNLAVKDTSDLGSNAATSTTVQSFSGTAGTSIANVSSGIAIGPYPWPVTVVLTMTGYYDLVDTVQEVLNYGISTSTSSFTDGYNRTLILSQTSGTDSQGVIAQEITYSLAANASATYYLNAQHQPAGVITGASLAGTIKAEVIKR